MSPYVCKPIKKGSEIFSSITFFSHIRKAERQEELKLFLGGVCDCIACENDWPTFDKLRAIDPFLMYRYFNTFSPPKEAKKIVAQNNAYVDKNYKEDDAIKEVYITIHLNLLEL